MDSLPPELLLMIFEKCDIFDMLFIELCSGYFYSITKYVKKETKICYLKDGCITRSSFDQVDKKHAIKIAYASSPSRYTYALSAFPRWNKSWVSDAIDYSVMNNFTETLKYIFNTEENRFNVRKRRIINGRDFHPDPPVNLMRTAISCGHIDIVKLLCYIGLKITKYHLHDAATYGQMEMLHFIFTPNNQISDEWLRENGITYKGNTYINYQFNITSKKIKNRMKQFYDIALPNDDVELYKFLRKYEIENPYEPERYFKRAIGWNKNRLAVYLFEDHTFYVRMTLEDSSLYAIKHNNSQFFFHIANNYIIFCCTDMLGRIRTMRHARAAAEYRNIAVFSYLTEQRKIVPKEVETLYEKVVYHKFLEGLKYLYYQGLKYPNDILKRMKICEFTEGIEFWLQAIRTEQPLSNHTKIEK